MKSRGALYNPTWEFAKRFTEMTPEPDLEAKDNLREARGGGGGGGKWARQTCEGKGLMTHRRAWRGGEE